MAPTSVSFRLPFLDGEGFLVNQGWNTPYSHNGRSAFAYDFGMPAGTPVLAAAAGRVAYTHVGETACGGPGLLDHANSVTIDHADGTATLYAHLARVDVAVGDVVAAGQPIGLSGNTGWTGCAAHLHFARQAQGGEVTQSMPIYFEEYPGHVFSAGMYVSARRPACVQTGPGLSRNAFCGTYLDGSLGSPAWLVRRDPAIDFDWEAAIAPGSDRPNAELAVGPFARRFSARWIGSFDFARPSLYDFTVATSDRVRLSIDGVAVLDQLATPAAASTSTVTMRLAAGDHLIELDFQHGRGSAYVQLAWATAYGGSFGNVR